MKLVKTLAAAAVLAMSSFTASATNITVGGVTWDPEQSSLTSQDFLSTGNFTQWYGSNSGSPTTVGIKTPGTVGSYLQGAGVINALNGVTSGFVCSTCQLTFTFGGLVFDNNTSGDNSLFNIASSLSSGFFNLYARTSTDFTQSFGSEAQLQKASQGSLFLSMSLVNLKEQSGFTPASGFLDSYWKVTGGAAKNYFGTTTQLFKSDVWFTASASLINPTSKFLSGNGTAIGDSQAVSAPTSLALLGLGLVGLAGLTRRKQAK